MCAGRTEKSLSNAGLQSGFKNEMFNPQPLNVRAMSEFKYACPVCGQHIKCDSSQAGTAMECPTCFQKIVVPQAPASENPKFILHGTKVGAERPLPAAVANVEATPPPAPKKSFFMPAIIFAVLFCVAGVATFLLRDKIFKPAAPPAPTATGDTPGQPPPPLPVDAEVKALFGEPGNLALNRPATAGSEQPQNPIPSGNDGNLATRWCASDGSLPQWWEVDLGGPAAITNTRVLWEHRAAYQYVITVSADHVKWTTVVDRRGNFIQAAFNSNDFSANGRYVRIVITGLEPGFWASFYEFQVYGSLNGSSTGGAKVTGNSTN